MKQPGRQDSASPEQKIWQHIWRLVAEPGVNALQFFVCHELLPGLFPNILAPDPEASTPALT